jgi:hypothetical protein
MRGPLWRLIPDTHEAGSGARRKEERVRRRTLLAGAALVAVPLLMMRAGASREGRWPSPTSPGLPGFRFLDGGSVSAPPARSLRGPPRPRRPAAARTAGARRTLCGAVRPGAAPARHHARRLVLRLLLPLLPRPHGSARGPRRPRAPHCMARAPSSATPPRPLPARRSRRTCRAPTRPFRRGSCERPSSRPTPTSPTLGASLGLDVPRLVADARGEVVARRLSTSARAAATLGIAATPALVVGRTLVSGAIPDDRLDALIAIERAEGPPPC